MPILHFFITTIRRQGRTRVDAVIHFFESGIADPIFLTQFQIKQLKVLSFYMFVSEVFI